MGAAVKAVVFDLGGVVFHWRPAELLKRVLPARVDDEASARQWALRFFGSDEWARFDRGTIEVPELVARLAQHTGLSQPEVQAVVDGVPGELQPLADTEALIARLQAAGVPLFYLSNMPVPYAAHLMDHHAVMRRFRAGVFSSHVHVIKPEAGMFEVATQRFGLQAHECLFLDDSAANVAAAQALGWQSLHFKDAAQAQAEIANNWAITP